MVVEKLEWCKVHIWSASTWDQAERKKNVGLSGPNQSLPSERDELLCACDRMPSSSLVSEKGDVESWYDAAAKE